MTNTLKKLNIAVACAGLLAIAAPGALAQGQMPGPMPGPMPGAMPGMGMMDRGMGGGMMGMMRMMAQCPMMMGGDMASHAEGRIAFLKAELVITDAQKAVWDAYAAAIAQNLQSMQATRAAMMKMMEAKTPVERLDNHIASMESRVAALKEIKPALAALYTALSADQRKKADELLTGMGCMM